MTYDAPYRLEPQRENNETTYILMHTCDGRIARIYSFSEARMIVEALNKLVLERAIAKVT